MPWISFSDKKLYLEELYNHNTSSELVVLSACNTSVGEIYKGEGVMSLSRGFFNSGAKSVVSSLWTVDDKATSEIMQSFYNNIKIGQTKSAALHNAKLNYINSHSLSKTSPYYWASFILIGDSGSIEIKNNNVFYYIIIGIIILFSLFFFCRKRKKLAKK